MRPECTSRNLRDIRFAQYSLKTVHKDFVRWSGAGMLDNAYRPAASRAFGTVPIAKAFVGLILCEESRWDGLNHFKLEKGRKESNENSGIGH